MTINIAIKNADEQKPNTLSSETKANWLISLNGKISHEVMRQTEAQSLTYPDDGDSDLLVPFPYDDLYEIYLMAMIDRAANDIDAYNNGVTLYTEALDRFRAYYNRTQPTASSMFKYII